MRVVEDANLYESWRNTGRGKVVLKRQDRNGQLTDEVVNGGKVFHITPNERRLNQEMAADDNLDVFQNGLLAPVKLIETAEDVSQFKANPNHLSEEDMAGLFKNKREFAGKLKLITNPLVLKRMLAMASDEDATLRQVDSIKARLEDVSPATHTEVQTLDAGAGARAVSTKAPGL